MNIIVGGGKYGCEAIDLLSEKGESFIVVDPDVDCLAAKQYKLTRYIDRSSKGQFFVRGDLLLVLNLLEDLEPSFVFPTAPIHISADLANVRFKLEPWTEGINSVLSRLPQETVLQAGKGKLVASFNRDRKCYDRCPMPEVCPSSGTRKPCSMTELMKFASPKAFILVSHSMAPGIGALKGCELLELLDWVATKNRFMIATTCDCHGVLSAFKKVSA